MASPVLACKSSGIERYFQKCVCLSQAARASLFAAASLTLAVTLPALAMSLACQKPNCPSIGRCDGR